MFNTRDGSAAKNRGIMGLVTQGTVSRPGQDNLECSTPGPVILLVLYPVLRPLSPALSSHCFLKKAIA
jgi:hypothetical protein